MKSYPTPKPKSPWREAMGPGYAVAPSDQLVRRLVPGVTRTPRP